MYPYYLESKEHVVDLYELKSDGRFQLTQVGKIGPVLIGYNYVLFENGIADYLKGLDIQGLRFEKATIWDKRTDVEYPNYQRAIINQHFTSGQINDINMDGLRFFVMENRYLFASPALKEILETSLSDILQFSEGLTQFAGEN